MVISLSRLESTLHLVSANIRQIRGMAHRGPYCFGFAHSKGILSLTIRIC
jgi:hypothetical protein